MSGVGGVGGVGGIGGVAGGVVRRLRKACHTICKQWKPRYIPRSYEQYII